MTANDFDAAAQRLAKGFAAQVERWSRQRGATPESVSAAVRAAEAVSLATGAGHTCTHLASVFADEDAAQARARLLGSGVVTTQERAEALPLVLDDDGRIYLHRYFDYEQRLARRLLAAARQPLDAPVPGTAERLAELFAPPQGAAAPVPTGSGSPPLLRWVVG